MIFETIEVFKFRYPLRSIAILGSLLGVSGVFWRYSYRELKSSRSDAKLTKVSRYEPAVKRLFWSTFFYTLSVVGALTSSFGLLTPISTLLTTLLLLSASGLFSIGAFNTYKGMMSE